MRRRVKPLYFLPFFIPVFSIYSMLGQGGGGQVVKRMSYVRVSLVFFILSSFYFSFLKNRAFEVECEASNIADI